MRKIMPFLIILLLSYSCQQQKGEEDSVRQELQFFTYSSLPKKAAMNAKVFELVKGWTEFNDLDSGFEALSTVENLEDLSLVLDDLVERQKQLEASTYPEEFDLPQVKSRQKVLKTFILKTRASVEYRVDATAPAIEMMEAYNALREQLHVLVNNTLDKELLSDE
jgi:hypothetical protein